jgi:glycosyltransferase involved in cell wall biosynthesis
MQNVLIYRNELLPFSETFILSQANALKKFRPIWAGLRRVDDHLDIDRYEVVTLNSSEAVQEKVKRRFFLRTGCAKSFQAKIESHKAKLVHAHFAIDACAILPIVRRLGIPLITTLHGYDITSHESNMTHWPTTRAYIRRRGELWRYTSRFLCVSEHIRRQATQRGFPEEKLQVHHTGVDLKKFALGQKRPSGNIVLFVGRLVEKKGCIHLIRAMSRVEKSIAGAQLTIVGDGPLRATLEREASYWLKNFLFVKRQSHAEVRKWMADASVLAVPSVRASDGDSEGLPTVICEAQAAGLPVVAFAADGVVEAFPEKLRCNLPQEGDERGLAERIGQLLTNDELWRYTSCMGRNYIEESFDLEHQTQKLEGIYDEAIAGLRVQA